MKNKIINFLLIFFAVLFVSYDIFCICQNPGTFMDNLTAFSHIWLVPAGFLLVCAIYRIKRGRSFIGSWKKWFKIVMAVFVFTGITISVVNLCQICGKESKTNAQQVNADYVILLGGGITKDGKLPKSVEFRAEAAEKYLKTPEGIHSICVVTGGTIKWLPYPEAPALKKYLVDSGINGERILVEDKALDTIQNLKNSCQLLSLEKGCSKEEILESKVVIVTNRFHLARAKKLAKILGFKNVYGIGAKVKVSAVPNVYAREILSYVKLNLRLLKTKGKL